MAVAVVSVPVSDVDSALEFYVGTLGFVLLEDEPMGPTMRWVQINPRAAARRSRSRPGSMRCGRAVNRA